MPLLVVLTFLLSVSALATAPVLERAETQIATGELKEAQIQLQAYINQERFHRGNFADSLAEPYLLLGDAQLADKNAKQAVLSYEHAWEVLRMNEGLETDTQIEALYRMSDALVEEGDYERANRVQERACEVVIQRYGINDSRSLPAMIKLIEWYESNRRFYAAKILYIEVMKIVKRDIPRTDPRWVDLGRAYARAMRNTVFPPMGGEGKFNGFEITVPGYEENPFGVPIPSSYSLGSGALNSVFEFVSDRNFDPVQQIRAKINLADWHQLFGRDTKSTQLYREIWQELNDRPAFRSSIFDTPQLLYIRLPQVVEDESETSTGLVELLLTISYRGKVTGRISQVVDPWDRSVEHYTRVAAREARFRPAFKDGKPVTTKGYVLTHRYPIRQSSG